LVAYPNREKAASRVTKAVVSLLLLATVVLILVVTIEGWSQLQGLEPVDFAWCAVYLVIAFYIQARWARGLLPIAAALGLLLLGISLLAGLGDAGTSWFDRGHAGFAAADSLFGGRGLSAHTLGVLTLAIAPVQLLLILFAMRGFTQNWQVEVEGPRPGTRRDDDHVQR
jgi:hypothetical protein